MEKFVLILTAILLQGEISYAGPANLADALKTASADQDQVAKSFKQAQKSHTVAENDSQGNRRILEQDDGTLVVQDVKK